jgi:HNH endonuclease
MSRAPTHAELVARFWASVNKNGPTQPHMTTPCWEWTASVLQDRGYGQFRAHRRKVTAHRFAYELVHGLVPEGLQVLHRCDNRRCVRAELGDDGHLYAGTHADNMADRDARGRTAVPVPVSLPGALNPSAKLNESIVAQIRALHAAGWTGARLARAFGTCESQVRNIVHRRCWKEIA